MRKANSKSSKSELCPIHMRWYAYSLTIPDSLIKLLYLQSVGGHYKSMQFVRETSRFELTYVVAASASDNTTIFLSEKFYYPNGFNAT